MVKINVDGKDYELTEKHEQVMKYIPEAIAMEQGGVSFILCRLKLLTLTKKPLSLSWRSSQLLILRLKILPKSNKTFWKTSLGRNLLAWLET